MGSGDKVARGIVGVSGFVAIGIGEGGKLVVCSGVGIGCGIA